MSELKTAPIGRYKDDMPLTRERMELVCRIYHSAAYASEATGRAPNTLLRQARKFGLSFRHSEDFDATQNDHVYSR